MVVEIYKPDFKAALKRLDLLTKEDVVKVIAEFPEFIRSANSHAIKYDIGTSDDERILEVITVGGQNVSFPQDFEVCENVTYKYDDISGGRVKTFHGYFLRTTYYNSNFRYDVLSADVLRVLIQETLSSYEKARCALAAAKIELRKQEIRKEAE